MHSPCVARCGLNEDDYCMGCYRHINEIVSWSSATDIDKQQILLQLDERKKYFSGINNSQALSRKKWLAAETDLNRQNKT
ncbi:DUF1289 domain-containing protein [Shewanella gaetbuli]